MDVLAEFKEYLTKDAKIKAFWKKIEEGRATYQDADAYASAISKKMASLVGSEFGSMSEFDSVVEELKADYMKAYSETAYYTKNVQNNVNARANIGMKAFEPHIDESRIESLLAKLQEEDARWLLGEDVIENIAKSAITDTIEYNAREQSEAGLYSYIERDTGSGCCEWCESMAGRYEYGSQPSDFFRVHKDCTCVITYKPSKRPIKKIRYETRTETNRKGETVRRTYKITE